MGAHIEIDPSGLQLHHIIPQALFVTGRPNRINFSSAAQVVFASATIDAPFHRGWSRGHSAYSAAVRTAVNNWMTTNGVNPAQMTRAQAQQLVRHIRNSRQTAIRGFFRTIRFGRAHFSFIKALGIKALIVGGITLGYSDYFGEGAQMGFSLVNRVGLCRALQTMEKLPARAFKIVNWDNRVIDVYVTKTGRENGSWSFVAVYTQKRWNIIAGSYNEAVYLIPPGCCPVLNRDGRGQPIIQHAPE